LIPPNVKHWHGAAPDRLFIHLAFQEVTDQGAGTKWLEKVNDADYQAPTVDPD
jgi:quercetin dioxygenase-like cupin family protein